MRLFWISVLSLTAAWAAEPADWIISARHVVTMDGQRRVIHDGAVVVTAEKIVAVGRRAELAKQYRAKKIVNKPNALLIPGLINTHTHAAMSLLRGIADDLRLQEWLEKFIFPAEGKNVDREFVRVGTELACLEMMLSGTTTYTDMYYFEDTVAETTKLAGMRGVLGQTIIGFPAPDYKTPLESLMGTEKFLARFQNDPLIVPSIAPHAIYTNAAETLKAARSLANSYRAPLLIHVSETKKENDDSLAQNKLSPVQYLESLGVLEGRTIAAHGIYTDAADWVVLKRRGVGVAHCPSSSMKLASGIAPVVKMLNAGVAVGLGPDGPAGSNNDFSLMEEMDLAAKLAKVFMRDPQALPARTAFEMATVLGARVVGLEDRIGSLEPGKLADLVTVSLDAPHAQPEHDPYSMLVYSLKSSDVEDVMIHGRWTVRGRVPLTLNPTAIATAARQIRAKVEESIRLPK